VQQVTCVFSFFFFSMIACFVLFCFLNSFVPVSGDSRAVLCRNGGTAYALSYDHKPQQVT
jgi:serine/threonine protein phosphatase PrpC